MEENMKNGVSEVINQKLSMKNDVRKDINQKLKDEFDALHKIVIQKGINSSEEVCMIVKTQIELARQIVREERALSGEAPYLLPPHALDN